MESERVESSPTEPPSPESRRRFEGLFRRHANRRSARPPAPPRRRDPTARSRGRAPLEPQGAVRGGERRTEARREMDDAARQRMTDGVVATARATGRLAARNTEVLRTALQAEERARDGLGASPPTGSGQMSPLHTTQPSGGPELRLASSTGAGAGAAAVAPASGDRTERTLALVERIERLVRSGRPALALTLRDGIPGRLEVERLAPG